MGMLSGLVTISKKFSSPANFSILLTACKKQFRIKVLESSIKVNVVCYSLLFCDRSITGTIIAQNWQHLRFSAHAERVEI
jgi:hypothetical protein